MMKRIARLKADASSKAAIIRAKAYAMAFYGIESAETGYAIEHEVECALCHSEHHGRSAPVREAPEHRCQVCHTARFESFEAGHPACASVQRGARPLAAGAPS